MRKFKKKKGGSKVSKQKKASILVCVTGQRDCDRLIHAGKEYAEETHLPLQVLCVQPTVNGFCAHSEEIEYLHQTSIEAGAEMTIYFHDDAALIAAGFAKQCRAVQIVTGMPDGRPNGFVEVMHRLLPSIPISMVSKEGKIYNMYPSYRYIKPAKASVLG